ncbi:MAG TPA: MmcQ/YjbR family DNA-binding protein [Flavitalea sp.]|nr:MmcQ/YjbR family DNA-binding protein [Flavitalea sp.]
MVDSEIFREMALSFPGATQQPHFDKTSFRANKKIFATLDVEKNLACLMLSPMDQSVFSSFDKSVIFPVPNKWGLQGATYVELKRVKKAMLKDVLNQAYAKVISKKKKNKV